MPRETRHQGNKAAGGRDWNGVQPVAWGIRTVDIPLPEVYRLLLEPSEQVQWNSALLMVKPRDASRIVSGSVMECSFRETGRVTISFENVLENREFTHVYVLKAVSLAVLGACRHRYEVSAMDGKTMLTQSVWFSPSGLGKLFKGWIVTGFQRQIYERITELEDHYRKLGKPQ